MKNKRVMETGSASLMNAFQPYEVQTLGFFRIPPGFPYAISNRYIVISSRSSLWLQQEVIAREQFLTPLNCCSSGSLQL